MSIWFTEELHPYYRKGIRIKRVLADEQTNISTCKSSRPNSSAMR
jgi:hypothetical protein